MSEPRTGGFRRLLTRVGLAVLLLVLCLCTTGAIQELGPRAPATGGVAATAHPPAHGLPPAHEPLPGAGPQSLLIKAIGLEAPVEAHGLDPLGGVEPPPYDRPGSVAWFNGGPPPGSAGAAVIVGHVDTERAPAVFAGLSVLKPGQKIGVLRTDGSTAEFTVEDISVVDNDHFDADKVYGPRDANRAELRVITCGGPYDRVRRAYTANVVVSAYLTGATDPTEQPQVREEEAPDPGDDDPDHAPGDDGPDHDGPDHDEPDHDEPEPDEDE
ncbi:class F sortase [Streptomyces sp. NPDC046215]|uniref:Class F sortase n=1 Tax=Streptomyces stramineus TaxID=173861 RepID=A0ABN0ZKB1_9ACTN